MANGKVCIGFSLPYVATYTEESGTITYGTAAPLARGVDVTITPDSNSENDFYADNQLAESAGDVFTGGSFSLTVDGLKAAAERLIMGLPAAGTDGWTAHGDDQVIPFVGIGYITRYMEEGVISYVPTIICKCKFDRIAKTAKTQEKEIDFQTQALGGKIYRSGNANHDWKWEGAEETSESAAQTKLLAKLNP